MKVENPLEVRPELSGGTCWLTPRMQHLFQRWTTLVVDLLPRGGVQRSTSVVSQQLEHLRLICLKDHANECGTVHSHTQGGTRWLAQSYAKYELLCVSMFTILFLWDRWLLCAKRKPALHWWLH